MMARKMVDKMVEADILIIGGGLAGCFAAIKASEAGARVVLWEKGVIERSGAASIGSLNWGPLPPEGLPNQRFAEFLDPKSDSRTFWGEPRVLEGTVDPNVLLARLEDGWSRIHDLESWGLNMRWDDGRYRIIGSYGTDELVALRYHGRDLKKKVAAKVRSLPITLFERTMGVDLLTKEGMVVGATGVNVRTGQFIVCKAKATILGTGRVHRLYNPRMGSEAGKYKMVHHSIETGDGHAMAFRACAELFNMEVAVSNNRDLLSQYDYLCFHFGGILKTKVPIVNAKGEKISDSFLHLSRYLEEYRAGRTPCFWDTTQLPEEMHKELEMAYQDERPIQLEFIKQRGMDSRSHRFEMTHYKPAQLSPMGGIVANEYGETSLKGLYAAGDAGGTSSVSGATTIGSRSGMRATEYARGLRLKEADQNQIMAQREVALMPLRNPRGEDWLEIEMKIRDIVERYCGAERSEGSLKQGLWRLRSVRERFLAEIGARNPHELMRTQEARNLFDLGEIHLLAALERKESGMGNYRLDHPELRDAPWRESVVVRKEGKEIKLLRRPMPSLKK